MSDDEFFAFCQANPELNIERSPQREIIILPRASTIFGIFRSNIGAQLYLWNTKQSSGVVFSSSAGFTLPDQSVKSPGASWLSLEKWNQLTPFNLPFILNFFRFGQLHFGMFRANRFFASDF